MEDISGYEKMLRGEPNLSPNPHLIRLQAEARVKLDAYNATPMSDGDKRYAMLREMMGSVGGTFCLVFSPLTLEYGKHIHLGNCFINFDCMFLDGAEIRIGDDTMVGPRVQFMASGHPVRYAERFARDPQNGEITGAWGISKPITIGEGCWIGAGAIILGGVTIGDRTTIGAGSVVTKSIPSDVLAVGNPCRVVKRLD